MIQNGANVNNPTEGGSRPLGPACYFNNFKIAKYLVEHGADVNYTNNCQYTCLMVACREGCFDIVQYLLEKGANPEAIDSWGESALHVAVDGSHISILKLLLETGMTMTKDNDGVTPLMTAAINGNPEIVRYLSTLSECSREDQITVMELLGTSFMFKERADISRTYHYFRKAMEERFRDPDDIIPKLIGPTVSPMIQRNVFR